MSEWNYNMDEAPRDRALMFSVNANARQIELLGRFDDDRHSHRPRPYWSYDFWGVTWARDHQPYAWRLLDPAPLPEGD